MGWRIHLEFPTLVLWVLGRDLPFLYLGVFHIKWRLHYIMSQGACEERLKYWMWTWFESKNIPNTDCGRQRSKWHGQVSRSLQTRWDHRLLMMSLCGTHPAIRKDHRGKPGGCSRDPSPGLSGAWVGCGKAALSTRFGKTRSKYTPREVVYWVQEASGKNDGPDKVLSNNRVQAEKLGRGSSRSGWAVSPKEESAHVADLYNLLCNCLLSAFDKLLRRRLKG